MRAKLRPIREDEGLSWGQFCKATTPPPVPVCEPQPLAFAREQDGTARAPPPSYPHLTNPSPSSQARR